MGVTKDNPQLDEFVWLRNLSQWEINELPERYRSKLRPGWYWVLVWAGFDGPHVSLICFVPLSDPMEEVSMILDKERHTVR